MDDADKEREARLKELNTKHQEGAADKEERRRLREQRLEELNTSHDAENERKGEA